LTSRVLTQGTAVIHGTVYDSTGATVPGVEVVARNTSTNFQRVSVTGEEGNFVISNLPVGVYELSGALPGFKRYVEQNIRLQVDENRRVSVILQVGEIADSVTVSSEAIQVDTRSGALKEVVDAERITGLPLDGRNVLQLQRLVPGSGGITGQGQAQNSSVSINGSRTNSNNYLLDGADNHDPYFNTPAVFPNPDALQEFSIQTSSYSAASGRNAGAMMNAVTRSGTNKFHGSLFEFLRNEKFNARNFFAVETPPFKRNQFGGTIGGPILRDKTFFFFAYQGWRERSAPGSITATVPTEEQRKGDLSGLDKQITDPATGEPFPGNIIPSDRLHPAIQNFLEAFVPLPNRPDGLLSFSSGEQFDQDQIIIKVDHNFDESNTLTGRLLWNKDVFQEATGNIPNFFAAIDYDNWNLTVSDTHVFSPSLLNVFRFTFNDIDRVQSTIVPGENTWNDFGAGFTRTFTAEATPGWNTNVAGYFRAFSRFPLNHFRQNYKFSDDFNWTVGAHQLQFGGAVTRSILDLQEFFLGDPMVRFRSTFTGDALGDFLLGRPDLVRQIAEDSNNPRTNEMAFFLQDDWSMSRRLTLNLGVRWEPYFPFIDTDDRFGQFRPAVQSTVFPTAPTGAVFPGDAGISRSMLRKRWANLGPRFGFAFDPFGTGKTSIRGGYGIFYSQIRQQAHNQISTNQPFSLKLDIINPPQGLDNPYSETGNPFPFSPPRGEEAENYQFVTPMNITMWDPD
ncbi:MAG: carboxypeptidase regulatory-like domain-containing protein, partial [Acidobacteriota bacterium]